MTLIPSGMTHQGWFRFDDRAACNPASGDMIVTSRFSHTSVGVPSDPDWQKEEWNMQPLLVSLDGEALHLLVRNRSTGWIAVLVQC